VISTPGERGRAVAGIELRAACSEGRAARLSPPSPFLSAADIPSVNPFSLADLRGQGRRRRGRERTLKSYRQKDSPPE